jgi:hypothetical protein
VPACEINSREYDPPVSLKCYAKRPLSCSWGEIKKPAAPRLDTLSHDDLTRFALWSYGLFLVFFRCPSPVESRSTKGQAPCLATPTRIMAKHRSSIKPGVARADGSGARLFVEYRRERPSLNSKLKSFYSTPVAPHSEFYMSPFGKARHLFNQLSPNSDNRGLLP